MLKDLNNYMYSAIIKQGEIKFLMRYNGGLAFLSRQAPPVEETKYYTT